MSLLPLKLEKPRDSLFFFPWNHFLQHINKYGGKEWIDYKELKQEVEKTKETKLLGFISPTTCKKWKGENWGKLFVVSYYKKLLFFLPGGTVLYK